MLSTRRKSIHPGEILWEEFLVPLIFLNQSSSCTLCPQKISPCRFDNVVDFGRTKPTENFGAISTTNFLEEVLDLSDALGTSPEFWINMQVSINLWEAKKKRKKVRPLARKKIRKKRLA